MSSTQLLELESGVVSAFYMLEPRARKVLPEGGWQALQESQARTAAGGNNQKADLQRRQNNKNRVENNAEAKDT